MGTVFIDKLCVECVIGIHAHERATRQRLLISVELDMDFRAAAAADDIDTAMDYVAVRELIETTAINGRFQLIETLAERLAEALMEEPVSNVRIEIQKPSALPGTSGVGVRTQRDRDASP